MEVSRGWFCRALCCPRTNKVENSKNSAPADAYKDTVFIYMSNALLEQRRMGTIVEALEKKGLHIKEMVFKKPEEEKLKETQLFEKTTAPADHSKPAIFSLWKGNDALNRAQEVITRVGKQHSVAKVDMSFTKTLKDTRKESELWLGTSSSTKESNGSQAAATEEGAEKENAESNHAEAPDAEQISNSEAVAAAQPVAVQEDAPPAYEDQPAAPAAEGEQQQPAGENEEGKKEN